MSVDPLDGNGQLFLCLQDLTLNSFRELAFRARAQRTDKNYYYEETNEPLQKL